MKKKHFYEKPSMKVFKLKQQAHLLSESAEVSATMDGKWTEEDI